VARTAMVAGGRAYTVSFDDPRRRGDLYQSIVIAQLGDELTGQPVQGTVRVTPGLRGARAKTARDGVGGVAGVPSRLFPRLDQQQYEFDLRFEVDGFVPVVLDALPFATQPTFPGTFADLNLGQLALRRLPVAITVRTMRLDPQNRPIALPGATVEISGVWRTLQDVPGPSVGAGLVALGPALSAARPRPGTTLERVVMPLVPEPVRRLRRAAEPGTRSLEVSRTGGLMPGSVVAVDGADADRVEYIGVDHVVGPVDAESPAALVLAFPVRRPHREEATVQEVTPTVLGPPTADLTAGGLPGDATVFVSSLAPFGGGPIVRITGGPSPDEHVTTAMYRVVTDAEGYGRLPPLTRVAAVELVATAPGPLAASTAFTPRYGVNENHLHLVLE
jgi:hypothetical protein